MAEKEILNLRLAFKNISDQTDNKYVSAIYTNLGNRFDSCGRFLLSFDFWNKAYQNDTNSGMPFINMANSMMYYGLNYINDKKYQAAYIQLAYQYFKFALPKLADKKISQQAKSFIEHIAVTYKTILDYRFYASDFIDETKDEVYSKWCSDNELCLNPLSNVNPNFISTRDDVELKHTSEELNDFFEEIKKDYNFCRRQFFSSTVSTAEEADLLRKSAFKEAYSLLDKVTYLISGILNISEKKNPRLNFNRVWYENLTKNKGIRADFIEKKNLMLRGLYWVSKDIYFNEGGFRSIIEPKAKEINDLRNFIEHKSFKFGKKTESDFTLQMPTTEFDECMLILLKLVRESILYSAYSSAKL